MQVGGYEFVKFIASGTFGGVWECRRQTTGTLVACKIIDIENLRNPEFFPHFKNELIIHSQICHPGITQLLDVILDKDNVYIFLELCEGGDLNDVVIQAGGLDEDVARHYFRQIMGAVSFIHMLKVAHRDIKLENILITRDGCAKLTDFGLCKQQSEGNLLLTACGTLVYAAPEIIKEQPYDGIKADIWSAGVVLYTMVANHFPWSSDEQLPPDRLVSETARQIINGEVTLPDGISSELENLLANMLNVDPDERPTSEEVMQHPWVEMGADDDPSMGNEPDPNLVNLVKSVIMKLEERMSELNAVKE